MHATVLHRLCKELTDGSHRGGNRIGHQQPVFTANTTEGKLFIQKRIDSGLPGSGIPPEVGRQPRHLCKGSGTIINSCYLPGGSRRGGSPRQKTRCGMRAYPLRVFTAPSFICHITQPQGKGTRSSTLVSPLPVEPGLGKLLKSSGRQWIRGSV